MTADSTVPVKRDGLNAHRVGTEYIVHDTLEKRIHVLNESAFRIWELCDGKAAVEDLVERILEGFADADTSVVRQDVLSTLEQLANKQLVVKEKR